MDPEKCPTFLYRLSMQSAQRIDVGVGEENQA